MAAALLARNALAMPVAAGNRAMQAYALILA